MVRAQGRGKHRTPDSGEILSPNAIRDLIDFSLRECVRREIPVRRCRNCGRYFPITGRVTAEYCSRPSASGKLCRSTAPVQKWAESRRSDQVFQEYRREYKRRSFLQSSFALGYSVHSSR